MSALPVSEFASYIHSRLYTHALYRSARFNRDPTSEPPTPFGNVSFETLEAHCVEKHLEGFEMLRKGAGFGKRPST